MLLLSCITIVSLLIFLFYLYFSDYIFFLLLSAQRETQDRFGITSFTYRARRPLSEQRFTEAGPRRRGEERQGARYVERSEALQKWPIPKHSDLKLMLDDTETNPGHPLCLGCTRSALWLSMVALFLA